jgi:hypothetical protein
MTLSSGGESKKLETRRLEPFLDFDGTAGKTQAVYQKLELLWGLFFLLIGYFSRMFEEK